MCGHNDSLFLNANTVCSLSARHRNPAVECLPNRMVPLLLAPAVKHSSGDIAPRGPAELRLAGVHRRLVRAVPDVRRVRGGRWGNNGSIVLNDSAYHCPQSSNPRSLTQLAAAMYTLFCSLSAAIAARCSLTCKGSKKGGAKERAKETASLPLFRGGHG